MNPDISNILNEWEYKGPNELLVRKIVGHNGQPKIQLRIDLGLMQMEWTGRPDGRRPYGSETLLDHYIAKLNKEKKTYGTDAGFSLSHEDCEQLKLESLQYYHRRISFFELEAYEEAGADAEHNLQIMDFVRNYASDDQDKLSFEQYRPFVLMHRARARGLLCVERKDIAGALRYIEEGIKEIEAFFRFYDREDLIEESQELTMLKEWAEQIRADRPRSPEERLRAALQEAVDNEEFEKAAEIRDALKRLEQKVQGGFGV